MLQPTHDGNAFAHARMFRILDQNIKGLFLGSMSLFRKEASTSMSSISYGNDHWRPATKRRGGAN